MDVCRTVDPDPFDVGAGHRAACHLWSAARSTQQVALR